MISYIKQEKKSIETDCKEKRSNKSITDQE